MSNEKREGKNKRRRDSLAKEEAWGRAGIDGEGEKKRFSLCRGERKDFWGGEGSDTVFFLSLRVWAKLNYIVELEKIKYIEFSEIGKSEPSVALFF